MRRGGRQSRAPTLPLISLLQASSTLSSSEAKGHTKYISQCHLEGGGGGGEMITSGLLTDLCGSELAGSISGFAPAAVGGDRDAEA